MLSTKLKVIATTAALVMYLFVAAAAVKLGGVKRWIAIAGILYSFWALYGAGFEANMWGAVLILAGIPVWWFMRGKKVVAAAT